MKSKCPCRVYEVSKYVKNACTFDFNEYLLLTIVIYIFDC